MNQSDKKSNISKTIVGIVVFGVVIFGVKHFFKQDIASELKKAAKEINAQAPMMVDEYTRLDSAAAVGKTELMYYYTVKDIEKSEVNIDTIKKYMKEAVIEDLRLKPEIKAFRENNITLGYNYYDKNGDLIFDLKATPKDYNTQKLDY